MSIEEVAAKTPELIFKEEIDPKVGLQPFQCRKVAFNLGLDDAQQRKHALSVSND